MVKEYSNQGVLLKRLLQQQGMEDATIDIVVEAMQSEFERVFSDLPIGVNALIVNNKNEILLSKRGKNAFMGGTRGLPWGHLEKMETFEEGIARECREELGIKVHTSDIYILVISETVLETEGSFKSVDWWRNGKEKWKLWNLTNVTKSDFSHLMPCLTNCFLGRK